MIQQWQQHLKKRFGNQKVRSITFIAIFSLLGLLAVFLTKATPTSTSLEPEDGTKSSQIYTCNEIRASNGHCVQFGSVPVSDVVPASLTVVATDAVSNAICIDSTAGNSKTACIQIKPNDATKARGGVYDIVNKQFTPKSLWLDLTDIPAASKITNKTCSGGHPFIGFGPLGSGGSTEYFGEEVSSSGITAFASIDASTNTCTTFGNGATNLARWNPTPTTYCSTPPVTSVSGLTNAVSSRGAGTEICVAGGNYMLTETLRLKQGMKLVGDPIDRAVLDASRLPSGSPFVIASSGSDALIANITAQGTKVSCAAKRNCGFGINGGARWHLNNVRMFNNDENGYHSSASGYIIENSEISNNGSEALVSDTSGGVKTTSAGTLRNNVVIGNIGDGLWCDGVHSTVCAGGRWIVTDNYVSANTGNGIHYEIAYNGADIKNNVVVGNNVSNVSWRAGISVWGKGVNVTNNIFHNNFRNGISIYTDHNRVSARYPGSSNNTAVNNYRNGDGVDCSDPLNGTGNDCSPNYP